MHTGTSDETKTGTPPGSPAPTRLRAIAREYITQKY
jgi:hypothetical protein